MPVAQARRARKSADADDIPTAQQSEVAVPGTPLPAMAMPVPEYDIETRMVPINQIDRGGDNHRLHNAHDKQRIQELAASMPTPDKQLQPIRVLARHGMPFLLAYGFRRTAAAELNGWESIRAEIVPMPTLPSGEPDTFAIQQMRARENLDRENLNPIEELQAVTQMLDALPVFNEGADGDDTEVSIYRTVNDGAHDKGFTPAAYEKVALAINRTPAWVRDRAYLARLCPKVRGMVIDGSLKPMYAREIAKCGDVEDQIDAADMMEDKPDRRRSMTFNELRAWIEQRMRNLKITPWKLDAPKESFPKNKLIVGACVGCPFNTATDRFLFDADGKAADDGRCTNGSCYRAKQEACEAKVQIAVGRIVNKKDGQATESAAAEVASSISAEFVKPATIARRAKKEMPEQPAKPDEKPKASKPKQPAKSYDDQVRDGQWKFQDAKRAWAQDASEAIVAHAKKNPGCLTTLVLIGFNKDASTYVHKESERLKQETRACKQIQPLLKAKATPEQIAFEDTLDTDDIFCSVDAPAVFATIAEAWGIELEPRPQEADFMPAKPAAEKKAPAKPAAKKKPAKKSK